MLAQGRIADGAPSGWYYTQLMLFGPVPRDAALAREEVCGPVLAALPLEHEADAIARANATQCGLLSAGWGKNGGRKQRVATAEKAVQVFVDCDDAGSSGELPFGSTRRSGHRREKGLIARKETDTSRTVALHHGRGWSTLRRQNFRAKPAPKAQARPRGLAASGRGQKCPTVTSPSSGPLKGCSQRTRAP